MLYLSSRLSGELYEGKAGKVESGIGEMNEVKS